MVMKLVSVSLRGDRAVAVPVSRLRACVGIGQWRSESQASRRLIKPACQCQWPTAVYGEQPIGSVCVPVCPALPVGPSPPKRIVGGGISAVEGRCLCANRSAVLSVMAAGRLRGAAAAACGGQQHAGRRSHAESRTRGHRRASSESNNALLRGAPQHTSPERGGGDFLVSFFLQAAQA
jgi:hypothetical protein